MAPADTIYMKNSVGVGGVQNHVAIYSKNRSITALHSGTHYYVSRATYDKAMHQEEGFQPTRLRGSQRETCTEGTFR